MKKMLFAVLCGSLLASCVYQPQEKIITMSEIRALEYGSYPKNYQKTIQQHLYNTLIDPNSLMIDGFTQPKKYLSIGAEESEFGSKVYDIIRYTRGYVVCARFNAKNSYGGYVGWETRGFIFYNGKITDEVVNYYDCEQAQKNEIIIIKSYKAPVKIVD